MPDYAWVDFHLASTVVVDSIDTSQSVVGTLAGLLSANILDPDLKHLKHRNSPSGNAVVFGRETTSCFQSQRSTK